MNWNTPKKKEPLRIWNVVRPLSLMPELTETAKASIERLKPINTIEII
jgi:hypothetical protein